MKNRIGWCNLTWNPVVGCRNDCEYCYAKKINNRFKFIENWNEPEWREKSFNKEFPKKPQRIFVGSMSEIYYWDVVWFQKVIDRIKQYPQHIFQFLTKHPKIYKEWVFPKNCWLGVTINCGRDAYKLNGFGGQNIYFLSIEPIFSYIPIDCINFVDWVIIGSETGNRKNKVSPRKEEIEVMVKQLQEKNIPIYLKNNLKNIYPKKIKEFPNRK